MENAGSWKISKNGHLYQEVPENLVGMIELYAEDAERVEAPPFSGPPASWGQTMNHHAEEFRAENWTVYTPCSSEESFEGEPVVDAEGAGPQDCCLRVQRTLPLEPKRVKFTLDGEEYIRVWSAKENWTIFQKKTS